jgi:hypothetical protein
MLLNYDRQLVNARRLARYRRTLQGADAGDEVRLSRQAKRRELVERVAREIVENLIITGSDNPIVQEIKDRLDQDYGEKLEIKYPPTELDIQIFTSGPSGPVELGQEEKARILQRLWKITLDKVSESML